MWRTRGRIHQDGVELLEPFDPLGHDDGLVRAAPPELARSGRVRSRSPIDRLSGEHHPAGVGLHDERLMTRRAARRRHDADPGRDVGLAAVELKAGLGEVVEARDRVVRRGARIELDLGEDRRVREARFRTAGSRRRWQFTTIRIFPMITPAVASASSRGRCTG